MNPPTMNDSAPPPIVVDPRENRRRLAARIRAARAAVDGDSTIPQRDPAAPARLSLAEEQLWYLEQFLGGTPTYNISRAWRLRGPLDRTALRASVDELVARHPGLRTTYASSDNEAVRVIRPAEGAAWHFTDRSDWPAENRAPEAERLARESATEPFDPRRGPLVRFELISFAPDDHVLVITLHHIIADGWSLGLMLRELGALYRGRRAGVTAETAPIPRDYADFAAWQRAQARAGAFDASLDYWEEQLRQAPAMLELPADRPRPATPSYRAELARARLPRSDTQALAALGAREGASLFTVLLAAYYVVLYRESGQDDLVVGSPFAGRTQPVLDHVVGYFANMLPLRASLAGEPTFREVVQRVREKVLAAFDRQDAPFAMIVERLRPPVRHAGVNPVFQAAFVLEEEGLVGLPNLADTTATMLPVDTGTAKFDVSLLIIETNEGLDLTIEASADVFDASMPVRLLNHYLRLLTDLLKHPDTSIGRAALMTPLERQLILQQWRGGRTSYPRNATVHGLFAEQARRHPDSVALVSGDRAMTYRELNRNAARLARRLRESGVRPGEFVAIAADRSMAFVVAALATLKAGAAYVPLDVHHPAGWLARMLDEAKPALLLVAPHYRGTIPPARAHTLTLDESIWSAADTADEGDHARITSAASTAYVMFTSGSTGRPKGTLVPHRAIVRLVRGNHFVQHASSDVYLLLANLAFDASTFEMWGPLLNGARLAIPTSPQPTLAQIAHDIRRHGVTTLWLTSGLFNLFVEERVGDLAGVRQLLAGGDALSPAHVAKALAALPDTRLINGYGPTENTVFTTCHPITAADVQRRSVTIGRPIANTTVYILDRHGEPVPVGVPGELYTGGDGVAQGYLNQPELTEERFVPDKFSTAPGARMYRTGDRCRWRHDGTIEFIGRIDQEVKVRGFRVDPAEIESALTLLPGVAEAAVVVRSGLEGEKFLVALVVAANGASLTAAHLREQLAARLPPHMVPASFKVIATMPLTANGKIDRAHPRGPAGRRSRRGVCPRWRRGTAHRHGTPSRGHLAVVVALQPRWSTGRFLLPWWPLAAGHAPDAPHPGGIRTDAAARRPARGPHDRAAGSTADRRGVGGARGYAGHASLARWRPRRAAVLYTRPGRLRIPSRASGARAGGVLPLL